MGSDSLELHVPAEETRQSLDLKFRWRFDDLTKKYAALSERVDSIEELLGTAGDDGELSVSVTVARRLIMYDSRIGEIEQKVDAGVRAASAVKDLEDMVEKLTVRYHRLADSTHDQVNPADLMPVKDLAERIDSNNLGIRYNRASIDRLHERVDRLQKTVSESLAARVVEQVGNALLRAVDKVRDR